MKRVAVALVLISDFGFQIPAAPSEIRNPKSEIGGQDNSQSPKNRDSELVKKTRAINQAIDWFLDGDPELREVGKKRLLEFGAAAVPCMEQRLAEKGYLDLCKLLHEIEFKGSPSALWVEEKDLPSLDELQRDVPKLGADAADRYVYTKYYEAYLFARKGHFEHALDLTNALITLEPKSRYIDKVKQLQRYCDNKVTQMTICEAKVIQPKLVFLAGEKVELTLRIKNVWKSQIVLAYEKGTPKEPRQGFAFVEMTLRTPDPNPGGGDVVENRSDELHFANELPIALGAQWEYSFTVDTGTGLDLSNMRIIEVDAWTQPVKVDLGKSSMAKRICFEPAVLKVVPRKYEKDLDNPVAALGKYTGSGTVNDVFTMAMILEGDQKEQGLTILMAELEKKENEKIRPVISRILTCMTDQKFGVDVKKWKEWFESRGKKPTAKDK